MPRSLLSRSLDRLDATPLTPGQAAPGDVASGDIPDGISQPFCLRATARVVVLGNVAQLVTNQETIIPNGRRFHVRRRLLRVLSSVADARCGMQVSRGGAVWFDGFGPLVVPQRVDSGEVIGNGTAEMDFHAIFEPGERIALMIACSTTINATTLSATAALYGYLHPV